MHVGVCVREGAVQLTWKETDGKKHHRGLLQTTCGKALASNVAWSIYVLHADRSTVHQREEASALATTPAVEWPRRPHLLLPASS